MRRTITVGVAAVVLWMGLFAAGILLDSKPYRDALRAHEEPAHGAASLTGHTRVQPAALDAAITNVASAPGLGGLDRLERRPLPADLANFGRAAVLFTPLNAGILTLLAALVGGCASWLAHQNETVPDQLTPEEKQRYRRRLDFLQENPVTATFRGFAVYLTVIAGVYIIGGDPFEQTTASQYVRFAGSVSLLAFMVGYDPTKLQELLDGLPRPGKKT